MKELSKEFEVIALSSEGPELHDIEEKIGVRTISVEIKRRPSILKDIVSLFNLIKVFRKEKPLIVHSMSAKCGMLSMLAARIVGVPHRVHSFSGLAFPTATGLARLVLKTTEKITCMSANHLLPEGKGVESALREYITKKPTRVLGYGNIRGINLEKYNRSPEVLHKASLIKEPDSFSFVFVGRIVKDKGINELVSAFCKLYEDHSQIRLHLVGGYDDGINPINESTLEAIKTHPGIMNHGHQADVLPYYALADCFVFPSYREGFPNVVIEAGAMGLPSIVTDIFGSNEIVEDGVNGLIVPPRNEELLLAAMTKILVDDELRNDLASKAREMVASRYEESFVQGCLINYYHEILSL